MSRWQPGAAQRLADAAIELFLQKGFDGTTIAEIAARAGVTSRTFFNHFPDKRDVLFGPPTMLQLEVIAREIAAATDVSSPLDVAVRAMQAAADEVFEGIRESAALRRSVIRATPELQERQQGKRLAQTQLIADGLRARGVEDASAALTGQVAVVLLETAERTWTAHGERRPLRELLGEARTSLGAIAPPVSRAATGAAVRG